MADLVADPDHAQLLPANLMLIVSKPRRMLCQSSLEMCLFAFLRSCTFLKTCNLGLIFAFTNSCTFQQAQPARVDSSCRLVEAARI